MYYYCNLRKLLSYLLLPVMILFSIQSTFGKTVDYRRQTVDCSAQRPVPGTQRPELNIDENPFRYSSYYRDVESGLYYLHARYYSSELMRFINMDSYDLSNRYTYCKSEPVLHIDPNGHEDVRKCFGTVIACAATVASLIFSIPTGGWSAIACSIWQGAGLLDAATLTTTVWSYYANNKTTGRHLRTASLVLGIAAGATALLAGGIKLFNAENAKVIEGVTDSASHTSPGTLFFDKTREILRRETEAVETEGSKLTSDRIPAGGLKPRDLAQKRLRLIKAVMNRDQSEIGNLVFNWDEVLCLTRDLETQNSAVDEQLRIFESLGTHAPRERDSINA